MGLSQAQLGETSQDEHSFALDGEDVPQDEARWRQDTGMERGWRGGDGGPQDEGPGRGRKGGPTRARGLEAHVFFYMSRQEKPTKYRRADLSHKRADKRSEDAINSVGNILRYCSIFQALD